MSVGKWNIRQSEELTLGTLASWSFYGGNLTLINLFDTKLEFSSSEG